MEKHRQPRLVCAAAAACGLFFSDGEDKKERKSKYNTCSVLAFRSRLTLFSFARAPVHRRYCIFIRTFLFRKEKEITIIHSFTNGRGWFPRFPFQPCPTCCCTEFTHTSVCVCATSFTNNFTRESGESSILSKYLRQVGSPKWDCDIYNTNTSRYWCPKVTDQNIAPARWRIYEMQT